MLPDLSQLLVVQDRDSRLIAIAAELAELPREEARSQRHLDGDLAAVAGLKKELQDNALATKNLQLDAGTRRTTIERLKQQQFETKKNEEYTALGKEVVRYTEMVDELETQELELMEAADELNTRLAEAETALGKTQTLVDEELKHCAQKRKNLEEQSAEVSADLAEQRGKVENKSLLSLYDRLLKSKGDKAMAEVVGDKCQGCHMKLVKGTLATLRAGNEFATCENCNRILYEL